MLLLSLFEQPSHTEHPVPFGLFLESSAQFPSRLAYPGNGTAWWWASSPWV